MKLWTRAGFGSFVFARRGNDYANSISNSCAEAAAAGSPPFPRKPLAFLWLFVRRNPLIHGAATLSVVGAAACACLSPYGLKMIVDGSTDNTGKMDHVWWGFATFLGLLAAENAFWRSGSFFGFRAILRDKSTIKLELLDHLIGHSARYFSDRMGGALVNRISSAGESVQQLLTTCLLTITAIFTDFCVSAGMLATVDWRLVAALAVFIMVSDGAMLLFARAGALRRIEYAFRAAEAAGELVDVLSNIWLVKAFSSRSREHDRFKKLFESEARAHQESLFFVERMRIGHDLALCLMAASILGFSVHLWSRGKISPGDIVLTAATVFRLLRYSRDLAFALVNSSHLAAQIAESLEVIGENHEVTDQRHARPAGHLNGHIRFESVSFTYPGGQPVFRDLDLQIYPGQRVGVVGPSGAGKSTLISLVQRAADIDAGRLLIDNQDIRAMTQESLRAAIAIVPQEVLLFHRSVLENIRYARPDAAYEEVLAAARIARCHEFIERLPRAYDTVIGEHGRKLSGGERQRLGIARALLKNAPIIILDEATSSLDTESEMEIHLALEALMKGRTVLGIAHRLSTVERFDRVIVLQEGRIVEDGLPSELRRRRGLFDQMCRLQERGRIMRRAQVQSSYHD